MSFSSNQILTAAQLNDLDIDSLVVDTDVLVVDKTNNRVGIGTTSPSYLLDVNGQAEFGAGNDLTPNSNGEGHLMILGSGYRGFASLDGTAMWLGHNSNGRSLYLATDETARLTVGGTGNVGIGTTTPSTKLEVADANPVKLTLKGTNGVVGGNSEVQSIDFYQSDASGGAGVSARIVGVGDNASGAQRFEFQTGQAGAASVATRMTIKSDGRVGIGTSTPDHVLSLAQISGGEPDLLNCVNNDGSEGFRVAAGVVRSATIANTTTSSSANVFVSTSSKTLFRSTVSALKYKTNVETMEDSYADAILGLRPVWYRSRCELDPESYGYWGFIAEEVAEIDPRLVTFGVPDDYEWQYEEDGEKIEPDVADLTEPEGVQYDRLVPHLVNLLARQRDQIADLSARVTELEA